MARRFLTSFKTSWRVGRLMGAETRLHVSFVVLAAYLFWVFYPQDQWDWLTLLMLITGFLISIVLHELGHTLAARRCGLAVTRLVLWPLGGFRALSRAPEKRRQRFLIHAAGPLASLFGALLLGGIYQADETPLSMWPYLDPVWAGLLYDAILYLAILNGLLVIVNLLPVDPLDGGGMLEAILGRRAGKGKTETVSIVIAGSIVPALVVLGIVAGTSELLVFCLMLALGIAAFNPFWRRWILGGMNTPAQEPTPAEPVHLSRAAVAGVCMLAFVVVASAGVLILRGPSEAPVLVFEHANLIDGISGTPQRNMTVVVTGGKIDVVSAASIAPPANAKRFDLGGRWLLPGFIDAHVHPNDIWSAKRWLMTDGMTTARSMFTVHYMDVALRERHRRGEFDIPDILAAGYPVLPNIGTFPIPGGMTAIYVDSPQLKDLRKGADIGAAGARRIVRANLDHHVDLIKVYVTNRAWFPDSDPRGRALSDEQLVAAVEEARSAGLPVAMHAYGDDGILAGVRAGVSTVEHGVYLADATLAAMKENGVSLVPTICEFPTPQPPGQVENRAPGADAMAARHREMAASVRDSARRAHNMGVRVLAGTDNAGSIGDEIVNLVGIGMTPMEAIQAATSRSAEAFGISKRTGSIRQGLEADLIVLDGNPLEDIKTVKKVVLVVNDGRIAANRLPTK